MPAPIIEAHRGASAEAPENTLAAFQLALDLQADSIELDVHPVADGTLVVIHDDTVDRTTHGTGAVASMTFGDLRKLDAGVKFHARFAGERIPTLDEVFGLVAPTATALNIEIKHPPPGMKVAEGVVEQLRRYGKADQYLVSSFDIDALLTIRRLAPEVTLALIGESRAALASASQLNLPWIHCSHPSLNARLLSQAHGSGIRVGVWTVNDPVAVRHWTALGVNRIITDNPRAMLALGLR